MAAILASSVEEYVRKLPKERRDVVSAMRALILKHLPKGYEESIHWGMISYVIPLNDFPETYNKQPLGYIGLAAQKNYYALYMMGVYADRHQQQFLKEQFALAGKKLDMGKSCLRFRSLEDLPLKALSEVIGSTATTKLIELYRSTQGKNSSDVSPSYSNW